jgi:hypothetical protein
MERKSEKREREDWDITSTALLPRPPPFELGSACEPQGDKEFTGHICLSRDLHVNPRVFPDSHTRRPSL